MSVSFKINQQTEAEKDDFLFDCFHDAGFITELIEKNFSIVSGRKGAGKTALARYLEHKASKYGLDTVYRISIRNISIPDSQEFKDHLNSILFFVLIKTVKKLLTENIFESKFATFWKDFLNTHGLQNALDYETFVETQKNLKTGFSIKGWVSSLFAKAEGGVNLEDNTSFTKSVTSNAPFSLFSTLKDSLPASKDIFVFIDDVSDYLDEADEKKLNQDLDTIRGLLLVLENYNSDLSDAHKHLRFVSLLREDLFDFMKGSNVNKLVNNCLKLEWNEDSFAGLLIRRLPFFSKDIGKHLEDPITAIRQEFPDEIFSRTLSEFKTNRYGSNFYAYMMGVSFNRPRDFLKFCYAMRERLSFSHVATFENIDSAEGEYSEYFTRELKDELYLISRLLKYDLKQENINELIDLLSERDGFNIAHLKTELSKYLGVKTKLGWNKIEEFIMELWRYGVVGFKEKQDQIINFKYISSSHPILAKKFKEYLFFLHRGLWWFVKKRKIEYQESDLLK